MRFVGRLLLAAFVASCLAAALVSSAFAYGSYPIYGIHFYGTGAENTIKNGKGMYSVEMYYTKDTATWTSTKWAQERTKLQNIVNLGFKVILRLDYYWDAAYSKGGVPLDGAWTDRLNFANQCYNIANYMGDLVEAFVIGNEIDIRSGMGPSAWWYAACFNTYDGNCAYDKIHQARPSAKVCIYAPTGWASQEQIDYWTAVLNYLDTDANGQAQVDAYALHAYSGSSTNTDMTVEDPRYGSKLDFKGFSEYAKRIYQRHGPWKPIYITEWNTYWYYGPWADTAILSQDSYRDDYIKEAFQAISEWNASNDQKIDALCWYVYQYQVPAGQGDQYENALCRTDNTRLNRARTDFSWVTYNTNMTPGYPGSTLHFEAENYSNSDVTSGRGDTNGIQNTDFYDTDTAQNGGEYRNQAVDIGRLPDWSGFFVGWTAAGEWLRYESLFGAYTYKIKIKWSRGVTGSSVVKLYVDGVQKGGDISLGGTGSWDTYSTYTGTSTFYISGAFHEVKLYFQNGSVNVDWFELVKV